MTLQAAVVVRCDSCDVQQQSYKTAPQFRKELRGLGWTTGAGLRFAFQDWCPACSQLRKEAMQDLREMTSAEREKRLGILAPAYQEFKRLSKQKADEYDRRKEKPCLPE